MLLSTLKSQLAPTLFQTRLATLLSTVNSHKKTPDNLGLLGENLE